MATRTLRALALTLAAATTLAACSDDPAKPAADAADSAAPDSDPSDTAAPPAADAIFAFGTDPAQTVSRAPFPNDLYLGAGGITLAPLGTDPAFATLASAATLTRFDGLIAGKRGFGFNTAVYFPMAAEPDLATFAGKVHLVALDGPEAGRALATDVFWYPEAGWLGVIVAFGDYQVPGTRYAVLIERGVAAGGVTVEPPAAFAAMLAATPPTGPDLALHTAFAGARAWLAAQGKAPADVVIGTVYTTEATLPVAKRLFEAADAWPLGPPTRNVRFDATAGTWQEAPAIDGAALASYFGTPTGDFATTPGTWAGNRAAAAELSTDGLPYAGGTVHAGIGRVLNGTLAMPAFHYALVNGAPENHAWRLDADGRPIGDVTHFVPFTLFLCDPHLAAPADLPVAIATHGGGGHRSEMTAFAVVNCKNNVATIALDLPFHGGRVKTVWDTATAAVLPARDDKHNTFTGKSEGEPDYAPDYLGDAGGVTDSVGPLFALPLSIDPAVAAANTAQISVENHMLARYLRDGDWSGVMAGLSFDPDRIFHEGLSFGASFTTLSLAMADDFRGIVSSVPSSAILSSNLPVAPTNAMLAGGFMRSVLKLKTPLERLNAAAWQDPAIATLQWLAQLGDPGGYAPYVLRYRPSGTSVSILAFGDSWDETLYTPAQLSMHAATGYAVFTQGPTWTLDPAIPAADTLDAAAWTGSPAVTGNVTFGAMSHTAGMFYFHKACHAETIVPFCEQRHAQPHPPVVPLAAPVVFASPICEMHHAIRTFMASLLADTTTLGTLAAPGGSCDALYGVR